MINKAMAFFLPVAAFLFVLACGYATYSLGMLFGMDSTFCGFVAVASVAATIGHAGQVLSSESNSSRMLNGIGLLVWLVMLLFFGACYFGAVSAGVKPGMDAAEINDMLAKSFLPADVLESGRVFLAYAPAIGLTTSLVTSVVSYAMSHPLSDSLHKTMGAAFAPMAKNVVLGLVVVASGLHVFSYGINYAGVGPFEAVAACVVAELAFIAGEQMALREIKARATKGTFDKADLIAWSALSMLALAYMLLINGVYGEMSKLISAGADLTAAHAQTDYGLFGLAKSLYNVSAPIFGGLLMLLSVVTTFVNVQGGRPKDETSAQPINIFKRGTPAPQLNSEGPEMPQLTGADADYVDGRKLLDELAAMTDEEYRNYVLATRAANEARKSAAKVSESGRPYDATGTIVMDEATEKARQRAKAERERMLRNEPPSIFGKEAGDPK